MCRLRFPGRTRGAGARLEPTQGLPNPLVSLQLCDRDFFRLRPLANVALAFQIEIRSEGRRRTG